MPTRKRWALAIVAGFLFLAIGLCVLAGPIFPAVPPAEFHQIKVGMHIKDVRPLFKQPPDVIDDKKEEDGRIISSPIWMYWRVHDGAILVRLDKDEFIDDVHFQASRSSLVEHAQELWSLTRFLH